MTDEHEQRHADTVDKWDTAVSMLAAEMFLSNGREHNLIWEAIAEIRDGFVELDHKLGRVRAVVADHEERLAS